MKQLTKLLSNIRSYSIRENSVYWNDSFEIFYFDGISNVSLFKATNSLQEIKYDSPYLYCNDSIGNAYFGVENFKLIKNVNIKKILNHDKILISIDGKTSIYSIVTNEIQDIFKYRIFIFNIINNLLVYKYEKEIQLYSFENNKPLWQYSLESLGTYRNFTNEVMPYEVIKFIGEHEGTLIVQLTNATLLFLDITTGKTEKIIHLNIELPILPTCHYDDSFPPHLVGDQLLWLNNQRYFTINLNTYEIKVVKDYFKEPKENQFRFMSNTYFEGKLYFVADIGWQYVVPTRIGVMDTVTGEVLWQHQLQKTGGLPEPPQVTQDKLFIRTTKGTLYIFENEYA